MILDDDDIEHAQQGCNSELSLQNSYHEVTQGSNQNDYGKFVQQCPGPEFQLQYSELCNNRDEAVAQQHEETVEQEEEVVEEDQVMAEEDLSNNYRFQLDMTEVQRDEEEIQRLAQELGNQEQEEVTQDKLRVQSSLTERAQNEKPQKIKGKAKDIHEEKKFQQDQKLKEGAELSMTAELDPPEFPSLPDNNNQISLSILSAPSPLGESSRNILNLEAQSPHSTVLINNSETSGPQSQQAKAPIQFVNLDESSDEKPLPIKKRPCKKKKSNLTKLSQKSKNFKFQKRKNKDLDTKKPGSDSTKKQIFHITKVNEEQPKNSQKSQKKEELENQLQKLQEALEQTLKNTQSQEKITSEDKQKFFKDLNEQADGSESDHVQPKKKARSKKLTKKALLIQLDETEKSANKKCRQQAKDPLLEFMDEFPAEDRIRLVKVNKILLKHFGLAGLEKIAQFQEAARQVKN